MSLVLNCQSCSMEQPIDNQGGGYIFQKKSCQFEGVSHSASGIYRYFNIEHNYFYFISVTGIKRYPYMNINWFLRAKSIWMLILHVGPYTRTVYIFSILLYPETLSLVDITQKHQAELCDRYSCCQRQANVKREGPFVLYLEVFLAQGMSAWE